MTYQQIAENIREKRSFLCVGLDTDILRIPEHMRRSEDPVFEFNKYIIDATYDLCIAYKPNLAFYEANGARGMESLQKTIEFIPADILTIADAKRGDIGNTSNLYAKAFFDQLSFDGITVNPYMGHDSILPFLDFKDKWVIILALTSNAGSKDFQIPGSLYREVIRKSSTWGNKDQIMYVAGATQTEYLEDIRSIIPDHFLLIPGIGAQGGDLDIVVKYGINSNVGLIVNSSRSILYASDGKDFATKARDNAKQIQIQMQKLMELHL